MCACMIAYITNNQSDPFVYYLSSVECTQQFKAMLDSQEFDFRFQCGVGEPAASMTLKDKEL